MDLDPCKKQREEADKAYDKWMAAKMAKTSLTISTKPIDQREDIERKSTEEQIDQAIDKEAEAEKEYLAAKKTHDECIATWYKKRPQG